MQARILSSGFLMFLGLSCLSPAQTQSPKKATPPTSHFANTTVPKTPAKTASGTQLLSADDGLAILGAALEGRYKAENRSDCSHLVHAIYEKAGFPYKYEKSTDLYAGVEEFRRVNQPQPGDMIVWPGHAGIVVSPTQHTFYSALRSGFGMQPYDSIYWKRRGRPHFFRYAKAGPQTVLASNRTAALKPSGFRGKSDADADSSDSPASEADSFEAASLETKVDLADRQPASDDLDANVPDPAPSPTLPTTVMVYATRLKADQIGNAIREQFQAFADTLETRDLLALQPAVMSFDRLDVQKLQLKGSKGTVQLRIYGAVALAQEGKRSQEERSSKQRMDVRSLQLHHANGGWEVALPANAIYLPRQTVVRILAHQLAALTDSSRPDDSRPAQLRDDHQVQLARWLNVLLEPR